MTENQPATPVRDLARPIHMLWLSVPYGIFYTAIIGGCLGFLMRKLGIPLEQIAQYNSLLTIPSAIYFLWSPLVDIGLPRRFWFLIANAVGIVLMACGILLLAHHLQLAILFLFLAASTNMLTSAACGGIMAEVFTPETKLRAASWYQLGNLAFGSIGTGLLIWLASTVGVPAWVCIAGALMFLPGLAALLIHEPKQSEHFDWIAHLKALGHEFRATILNTKNLSALLLLSGAAGAGAILNFFPTIAQDYHVPDTMLAWINGPAGGITLALGCFVSGRLSPRISNRFAYGFLGLLLAIPSLLLWLGPATVVTYICGYVLYTFLLGCGYVYFSALVLEVVGAAGKSGSARYTVLVSLGNLPIAYMGWLEGAGAKHLGFRGFAMVETFGALMAIPLLIWVVRQSGILKPVVVASEIATEAEQA
jgi:PAT family beta-lactamase induction signal transducer AmpG